jgi:hypothetical protein
MRIGSDDCDFTRNQRSLPEYRAGLAPFSAGNGQQSQFFVGKQGAAATVVISFTIKATRKIVSRVITRPIFEIAGGSMLPGLGRVEAIKRQDGDWVVVTTQGIIASVPSVIPAERVQ